ncbi:MAG: hypothetical protein ACOYMN_25535 [Roseimicrobium sp.]
MKWPAPFDDVMRRIMDGALDDGKEAMRHTNYSEAWLKKWQPEDEARVRREQERRKPGRGAVLNQAEERSKELLALGRNSEAQIWIFTGATNAVIKERLIKAEAQLVAEWSQHTESEVKAGAEAIAKRAADMPNQQWDECEAIEALGFWKTLQARNQRSKAGKGGKSKKKTRRSSKKAAGSTQ